MSITTATVVRRIEESYPIGGWLVDGAPYTWTGIVSLGRIATRQEILAACRAGIPGLPMVVRSSAPADGLQPGWLPSIESMSSNVTANDWYVHLAATRTDQIACIA